MKYLKKFILNESVIQNEFQEFCDNHLAYLLDKGFYCEIEQIKVGEFGASRDPNSYSILIKKNGRDDNSSRLFYWEDIKDDLIPFIILLYKNYDQVSYGNSMNIHDRHNGSEFISIGNPKLGYYRKSEIKEDYLDKLDIDYPILSIGFKISGN